MDRIEAGLYQKFSKIGSVEAFVKAVALTNVNGDPTLALTSMVSRIGALSVATLASHLLPPGNTTFDSNKGAGKKIGSLNLGSLPPIINHDHYDGELERSLREFVFEYQFLAEIPIYALLGMFITKNASQKLLEINYRRQSRGKSKFEKILMKLKNEQISRHSSMAGGVIGGLIGIIRNLDL